MKFLNSSLIKSKIKAKIGLNLKKISDFTKVLKFNITKP